MHLRRDIKTVAELFKSPATIRYRENFSFSLFPSFRVVFLFRENCNKVARNDCDEKRERLRNYQVSRDDLLIYKSKERFSLKFYRCYYIAFRVLLKK